MNPAPKPPDLSPGKAQLQWSDTVTISGVGDDGKPTTFSAFQQNSYVVRATWKGWDGWVVMACPPNARGLGLRNNPAFEKALRVELAERAQQLENDRPPLAGSAEDPPQDAEVVGGPV